MTENENNDKNFKQEVDDKKETEEPESVEDKQKIDELDILLEKREAKIITFTS